MARVVLDAKHWDICLGAFSRITSPALVSRIAMDKFAVEKTLAMIAVEERDPGIQRAAVDKLTDSVLLSKVVG